MNVSLNRRDFAKGLGGIVLAFTLDPAAAQQPPRLPGSLNNNRTLDAWIRINPDGTATVFTGKVELGQGIVTALAQIAAEELDLPLARVAMISGDTGRTPNEGMTAGSQSIENSGTALRMAAAEVRAILIEQASGRLGMSADSLSVADGAISAANGKTITYTNVVRRWVRLGDWVGKSESFSVPLKDLQTGAIDSIAVIVQHGAPSSPKLMLGASQVAIR